MATSSTEGLLSVVKQHFSVRSVIDFGCARGCWLAQWKEWGVEKIVGVDGHYLEGQILSIHPSEIVFHDLSEPLDLGEQFDLVQSLEVAEHLPPSAAETFIETLCRHGQIVLFSAALPGQGGMGHLNEQPYDFWRELFLAQGFVPIDIIRPAIRGNRAIQPWYRYNTIVYVSKDVVDSLPGMITTFCVPSESPITDIAPRLYKFRRLLLRPLPVICVDWLSSVNSWLFQKS